MRKFIAYIPLVGYLYVTMYYFIYWKTPFKTEFNTLFYWGMYQLVCCLVGILAATILKTTL